MPWCSIFWGWLGVKVLESPYWGLCFVLNSKLRGDTLLQHSKLVYWALLFPKMICFLGDSALKCLLQSKWTLLNNSEKERVLQSKMSRLPWLAATGILVSSSFSLCWSTLIDIFNYFDLFYLSLFISFRGCTERPAEERSGSCCQKVFTDCCWRFASYCTRWEKGSCDWA